MLATLEAEPRYDAVLLDIRMPRLGGCDAARGIRRRTDEKARTPLVAFSADTLDVWQKNAEAAGSRKALHGRQSDGSARRGA